MAEKKVDFTRTYTHKQRKSFKAPHPRMRSDMKRLFFLVRPRTKSSALRASRASLSIVLSGLFFSTVSMIPGTWHWYTRFLFFLSARVPGDWDSTHLTSKMVRMQNQP